jgi:hypothetical protein
MLVVPEMIQVELVTVRPVPVTVTVAALITGIDRGSRGVRVTGSAAARETTMLLMMSQRCPGGPPASRSSGKTISSG